ncbi:MAG: ParA family protein [Cyclobacteriaceae bacterium]|nr:ParA family protein [Cyclobacteriaceae bacterium]
MNIIIGNQKGGVGKTTHAILLANYLSLEKRKELLILDMDFQGSIKTKWDQDLEIFENEPLYEVIQLDLESFSSIFDKLNSTSGYVIIDLPGKIDDNNLVLVFEQADVVICPFSYDKLTFESTIVFAQVIRHINMEVPIIFLANRLKATVNYSIKKQVNQALSEFGTIAPVIPDRISLQRLDCFTISENALSAIKEAYEFIYNAYLSNHPSKTTTTD